MKIEFTVSVEKKELDGREFYRSIIVSDTPYTQDGKNLIRKEHIATEGRDLSDENESQQRDAFFRAVGIVLRHKFQQVFSLPATPSDIYFREHPGEFVK